MTLIKDESIKVLLDRREEIKNQINKLQAEYTAIGDLIKRDYNHTHQSQCDMEYRGGER